GKRKLRGIDAGQLVSLGHYLRESQTLDTSQPPSCKHLQRLHRTLCHRWRGTSHYTLFGPSRLPRGLHRPCPCQRDGGCQKFLRTRADIDCGLPHAPRHVSFSRPCCQPCSGLDRAYAIQMADVSHLSGASFARPPWPACVSKSTPT